jgi:hypothetical protein
VIPARRLAPLVATLKAAAVPSVVAWIAREIMRGRAQPILAAST